MPFGQHFGVAAEAVGDGGGEGFEELAAFLDEGADAGGAGGGVLFVLVLFTDLAADGGTGGDWRG